MRYRPSASRSRRDGFSLIELTVVLTIMAVLLTIGGLFLGPAMSSNDLARESEGFVFGMVEARQRAVSKSTTVEVRFYRYENSERAEQEARFFSWELRELRENGIWAPFGERRDLGGSIIFSELPKLSSLLTDSSQQPVAVVDVDEVEDFRGDPLADFIAFRFRADGSTDLPPRPFDRPDDQWFVTFHKDTAFSASAVSDPEGEEPALPGNFVTVQIDPLSGQVRSFRP